MIFIRLFKSKIIWVNIMTDSVFDEIWDLKGSEWVWKDRDVDQVGADRHQTRGGGQSRCRDTEKDDSWLLWWLRPFIILSED